MLDARWNSAKEPVEVVTVLLTDDSASVAPLFTG